MTDLPRFIQSFDELKPRFDFVEIGGMKSDVSSGSLYSKFLSVHTFDGSIDGHFSAEKRLDISGDLQSVFTPDIAIRPGIDIVQANYNNVNDM